MSGTLYQKRKNRSLAVIALTFSILVAGCSLQSDASTTTSSIKKTSTSIDVTTTVPDVTTTTTQEDCFDEKYEASCYEVGDIGPSGGLIFYANWGVSGNKCSPLCRYLELAPTEIPSSMMWCDNVSLFKDATTWEMGGGELNTEIYQNLCRSGAVYEAANYVSPDGTDDWYLPSGGELNELCKFARNQPTGNLRVDCAETGYLRIGFTDGTYWSSTENKADDSRFGHSAFGQSFMNGESVNTRKTADFQVFAIRMF